MQHSKTELTSTTQTKPSETNKGIKTSKTVEGVQTVETVTAAATTSCQAPSNSTAINPETVIGASKGSHCSGVTSKVRKPYRKKVCGKHLSGDFAVQSLTFNSAGKAHPLRWIRFGGEKSTQLGFATVDIGMIIYGYKSLTSKYLARLSPKHRTEVIIPGHKGRPWIYLSARGVMLLLDYCASMSTTQEFRQWFLSNLAVPLEATKDFEEENGGYQGVEVISSYPTSSATINAHSELGPSQDDLDIPRDVTAVVVATFPRNAAREVPTQSPSNTIYDLPSQSDSDTDSESDPDEVLLEYLKRDYCENTEDFATIECCTTEPQTKRIRVEEILSK